MVKYISKLTFITRFRRLRILLIKYIIDNFGALCNDLLNKLSHFKEVLKFWKKKKITEEEYMFFETCFDIFLKLIINFAAWDKSFNFSTNYSPGCNSFNRVQIIQQDRNLLTECKYFWIHCVTSHLFPWWWNFCANGRFHWVFSEFSETQRKLCSTKFLHQKISWNSNILIFGRLILSRHCGFLNET